MEWLTPEETAEYLKIHKHTVYDYIKRKKIPAVKFGRYYRIPKEKLDELLLGNLEESKTVKLPLI